MGFLNGTPLKSLAKVSSRNSAYGIYILDPGLGGVSSLCRALFSSSRFT